MDKQPVVVFGGTGFLGRRVVRSLVEAGRRVRVVARHPAAQPFADLPAERVERVAADLRDEHQVRRALQGAEAAVNAVSLYVEKGGLTFQAIHLEGARRLAHCAGEAGLRQFVHVSGLGVNADSPSAFIRARASGEEAVRQVFPQATIVRPSVMIGCDDAFLRSLNLITRLRLVPLFGNGSTRLQPAYVEDVAAGIAKLVQQRFPAGGPLEFGGGEIYTYRQAVQRVADFFSRSVLTFAVPFSVWHLLVKVFAVLPTPPLTEDQVILMEQDNVTSPTAPGFAELAIQPRSLAEVLPLCFARE